jgi:hypothetical protein
MRLATVAALLSCIASCKPSTAPPPAPEGKPDAAVASCVDLWLTQRELNQYGDPVGTLYAGGTPLFDEKTGKTTNRMVYLVSKHPELQQACPREVLGGHAQ